MPAASLVRRCWHLVTLQTTCSVFGARGLQAFMATGSPCAPGKIASSSYRMKARDLTSGLPALPVGLSEILQTADWLATFELKAFGMHAAHQTLPRGPPEVAQISPRIPPRFPNKGANSGTRTARKHDVYFRLVVRRRWRSAGLLDLLLGDPSPSREQLDHPEEGLDVTAHFRKARLHHVLREDQALGGLAGNLRGGTLHPMDDLDVGHELGVSTEQPEHLDHPFLGVVPKKARGGNRRVVGHVTPPTKLGVPVHDPDPF